MSVRRLRISRTAGLTVSGLGAIVAGLWTLAATLFGAGVGAGVGLVCVGLALLVIEGLSS